MTRAARYLSLISAWRIATISVNDEENFQSINTRPRVNIAICRNSAWLALVLFPARKGLREPNSSAYLDLSLMARTPGKCGSPEMHSGTLARGPSLSFASFIRGRPKSSAHKRPLEWPPNERRKGERTRAPSNRPY